MTAHVAHNVLVVSWEKAHPDAGPRDASDDAADGDGGDSASDAGVRDATGDAP